MSTQDIGKEVTGAAAGELVGGRVTEPTTNSFVNNMAESVVLAAAWFTVRMICQVSYKAVKSIRKGKQGIAILKAKRDPDTKGGPEADGACAPAHGGDSRGGTGYHGYVPAVSAEDEANDESCIPWGPAAVKTAEPPRQAPTSLLRDQDSAWVEELRRAMNSRSRDGLRILGEIQGIGDKIDNLPLDALYTKLKEAMKLLLEYQQNPGFRTAPDKLKRADKLATSVYNNELSLVMSLSALRLRIVITYIHHPKHSKGLEPSMDDKEQDKRHCHILITNALTQAPLQSLCRTFLAARDSRDKQETMLAFDIILEVISSVYLLEPFRPSEGPMPKGVPDIVLHALSAYCKSELGSSRIYTDLAQALKEWESSPQRKEKWALHCLYKSTDGPAWACSEGWDNLFEAELSSLYGVSAEAGRVTKISLGVNNLKGWLPPELENLDRLQELSLPGNNLFGKVPAAIWNLPCLQVVALHGNSFSVIPPERFQPAACSGASAGGGVQEPERRRLGVAGKVESRNPGRLEVYKGEWFVCSWNITNTGGVAFGKGTKLSRGDEHSYLGGPVDVAVNPLAPGEEQTVTVMQQAPNYETWAIQDEWTLVGDGLDFVDNEAKALSPDVTVVPRPAGGGKKSAGDDEDTRTLANTVFVAADRHHHGSSSSSPFDQFSPLSGAYSSYHPPR